MRLALLDLDGTLFDRAHAFEFSVKLLSEELNLEPEDFVPFVVKADNDGLSGWPHWMHQAQQRFRFPGRVDQLIIEQWERYLSVIPLATSSIEGLRCLRDSGWRTVIVTNGSASQLDIARKCGVLDAVDECIVSGIVGVRKPELEIFEIAADSVNQSLDVRTTWMVGDSPEADVGGARRANINSIWITRGRRWRHDDFRPDLEVDVIGDAFTVLANLGEYSL